MKQDEIIEMAEQAGVAFASDEYPDIWQTHMHVGKEELVAFAKLIAAKEREACLKICDEFPDIGHVDKKITDDYHSYLIRLRGEA